MYRSVNVDVAVEHLKNIVDSNRCAVCDRLDGTRTRYPCGHTSCEDCVVLASDCSVCLTPPLQSTSRQIILDNPFTQRAANASNLLNVFQNEFHIDVYKRHRISEQLKAEREVFPECIQAPAKYINKRKSFQISKLEKENRLSQLPGEEISPIKNHKMERSGENVEIWLNKYVPRKPFAELSSNDAVLRINTQAIKKQHNTSNIENTLLKKSDRKRRHSKTALPISKNQTLIVDHLTPVKKTKILNKKPENKKISSKVDTSKDSHTGLNINNTIDNNESGIVMDDEAVIVIDDSQTIKVDKDMNAWLAVLEAEQNKKNETTTFNSTKSLHMIQLEDKAMGDKKYAKVPFYLKGQLSKCIESFKCNDCNVSNQVPESEITSNDIPTIQAESEDVSITVENKHFITVIKIKSDDKTENKLCMQSVGVETDTSGIIPVKGNVDNRYHATPSLDIFRDSEKNEIANKKMNVDINKPDSKKFKNADKEMYVIKNKQDNEKHEIANKKTDVNINKTVNVIIAESDSDTDIEDSVSLEVTADIHRSCEEVDYSILADVDSLEEHNKRARRPPRGVTPTSSNSSEKENYNPNKMKRATTSKKKPMKK